ncbi:hypothetical protein C8R44DRAFT_926783 [Mycena epipterygia]|nr:hypothetical protein C8R44DRAFT_926783 [Mycena epipterygia]
MNPPPTVPEISSPFPTTPRVLHREWKTIKPYLPKSTSLPAFQLVPRDRPRFTCTTCGFVNFYNIPLCVWCATEGPESSVRAFEGTMPRARTASAPPRVFWKPNELRTSRGRAFTLSRDLDYRRETPKSQGLAKLFRLRGHARTPSAPSFVSSDTHIDGTRRAQSVMVPLLDGPGSGRPQTHKRSHSQSDALRLGHPSRPYYSAAIRKDTSCHPNSAARTRMAAPLALSPLASQTHCLLPPIPINDDEVDDIERNTFAFVSPVAPPDEAGTPQRTLSARISRRLASPVSALHSISREAEMRSALAALVRQDHDSENHDDDGLVAAHLRKLRRSLTGLVRRTTAR